MQISGVSSSPYLQQLQQSLFQKADSNADGSLSIDEFTASSSASSTGSASSSDKTAKAQALFKSIDTNGDGKVTGDELGSFFTRLGSDTQSSLLQLQQQSGADKTTAKSGHAHHGGHTPPPANSDDDDDGTSLADILAGTSASSASPGGTDPLADLLSGNAAPDDSSTGSLADVLAKMSDAADTGTDVQTDFSKQISGYLQQMLSGYADQAKNGASTASISVTA